MQHAANLGFVVARESKQDLGPRQDGLAADVLTDPRSGLPIVVPTCTTPVPHPDTDQKEVLTHASTA